MFNTGFSQYFQNGLFSDLTVVVNGGRPHAVHKLILAYSSDYFKRFLEGLAGGSSQGAGGDTAGETGEKKSHQVIVEDEIEETSYLKSTTSSKLISSDDSDDDETSSISMLNASSAASTPLGIGSSRLSSPLSKTSSSLNFQQSKPLPIIDTKSTSSSSSWIKSSPNNSSGSSSSSNIINSSSSNNNMHPPIRRTTSSISQSISFLLHSNKPKIPNLTQTNSSSNINIPQKTNIYSSSSTSSSPSSSSSFEQPSLSFSSASTVIPTPKPIIKHSNNGGLVLEFEIDTVSEPSLKIFELILEYCYTGQIDITDENCITIFFFSNYFQMLRLRKQTVEHINEHITRKNALLWIEKSIELSINEIIPKCIFVIARNFSQIVEQPVQSPSSQSTVTINPIHNYNNFSFLPIDIFSQILGNPSLSVFSEFTIYQAICKYIDARKLVNPEEIEQLFLHVKFPYLTYQEYIQVSQNPLVPQRLLTEGLLVRLGNFEQPSSDFIQKKLQIPRLMKRKSPARIFEYTGDFDNKGVLYYISTNGSTTEWSNPSFLQSTSTSSSLIQKIKVTSSSIEKGSASDILELFPRECWTKDIPSSWYSVDLGKYALILKYYTLRHGQNSKNDGLCNWVLQGSDDGQDWYSISRHTNENHFISNFISHSFPVTCSSAYRFFRILQIGHNRSGNNFLALSGIEFYGELLSS